MSVRYSQPSEPTVPSSLTKRMEWICDDCTNLEEEFKQVYEPTDKLRIINRLLKLPDDYDFITVQLSSLPNEVLVMPRPRRRLLVDHPPGRYATRVFVGGNYDYLATIRKIGDFVASSGFTPILAWDFDVPRSRTHDCDLRLLHQCKFAIFEETIPAGELMELERTRDYGVIAFIVYQVRESTQPPPNQISSMATTYGVPLIGYSTFQELENFIHTVFEPMRNEDFGEAALVITRTQWLPPRTKSLVIRALAVIERVNG